MARTDLLHRFQCLYRDFEAAHSSGRTVQQVQSARLARKPSRREFLSGAAAMATVAAVSASQRALGASSPRIVIVGAGIAGLNAALTLQDAGYPSTIYEASGRPGGRMHSDTTSWANGQVSEHCGEFIDSGHKTILGLAKRFKIPVADLSSAEPPQSTETYYFFGQRYTRRTGERRLQRGLPGCETRLDGSRIPDRLLQLYGRGGRAGPYQRVRLDRKPRARRPWIDDGATAGHRL